MEDRVINDMWEGAVPVLFTLAAHEVTSMDPPVALMLLLPRMSYLPLCTAEVRAHFLPHAPAREDEMWFEHDGTPLKWNLPVGVLFDVFGGRDRAPWAVTVHFQAFPEKRLMRVKNVFSVRAHFVNSFKEACALRHGSAKALANVSAAEQNRLWDSVVQCKPSAFLALRNTIVGSVDKLENLPVRVLTMGFDRDAKATAAAAATATPNAAASSSSASSAAAAYAAAASGGAPTAAAAKASSEKEKEKESDDSGGGSDGIDYRVMQPAVKPDADSGKPQTIESLFRHILPGLVFATDSSASSSASTDAASAASAASASASASTAAPASAAGGGGGGGRLKHVQVIVQGFCPPVNTPLQWLVDNCCAPDQFLYIAVVNTRGLAAH